jgi:uncharacterized protein (TIGR03000 family)
MYSLVLLTAIAPGADVTPAPVPAGCHGFAAAGCFGSCFGSCYGSGYGSCFGSCHGSCHGGFLGLRHGGGLFGHRKSCHGCQGYSCSGYNCFGSCHGSCFGSCHGAGCTGAGCHGCYGGGAAAGGMSVAPAVTMPPYTLHNYADPLAVYGRVTNMHPVSNPAAAPVPMIPPVPPADDKQTAAKIKFQLPAEARLFVDGKLTLLSGTERAFTTPPLAAGEKFFYEVKAELVVDGKPVVEEKRVVVQAGADLTESFSTLLAAAKTSGNAVAGK